MDDAALKLTQAVLVRVEGLEGKIDKHLADLDALQIFRSGEQRYQ